MTLRIACFDDLVERARNLADVADAAGKGTDADGARGRRVVLGIAGSPGSGKTTLAQALVAALAASPPPGAGPEWVVHVPMDGYHLADVELDRLGHLGRKGAPDTFDTDGYAALLRRLMTDGRHETVYAPAFDREIEQPVAGAVPVRPECRLVVSEGNYLLLDTPPWRRAREQMAEVWWCEVDAAVRRDRLVRRHVQFGKSPDAALAWVIGTDEPNARLVEDAAASADLVVLSRWASPRSA